MPTLGGEQKQAMLYLHDDGIRNVLSKAILDKVLL